MVGEKVMSIWSKGRYAANVKWIAQLLYNGGVEELEAWLDEQEQHVKDDIVTLIKQLSVHIESHCQHTRVCEGEYVQPKVTDELTDRPRLVRGPKTKSHLRIVKKQDKKDPPLK